MNSSDEKNKELLDKNSELLDKLTKINIHQIDSIIEENRILKEANQLLQVENEKLKEEVQRLSKQVEKLSERIENETKTKRQLDDFSRQLLDAQNFIFPVRIRQLIEQFKQKVAKDKGLKSQDIDVKIINIAEYKLNPSDIKILLKSNNYGNKVVHTPNEDEIAIAIAIYKTSNLKLRDGLQRIFMATFGRDPFECFNNEYENFDDFDE